MNVDVAIIAAAMTFLQAQGLHFPDYKPVATIENATTIQKTAGVPAIGTCVYKHIMISDDVNLNTLLGKSVVVHELTHFTQGCPYTKDITTRQYLENEKQAYAMQNLYLKLNGLDYTVTNPHEAHAELLEQVDELKKELRQLQDILARQDQQIRKLQEMLK